jgi:hypothetical protein
MTKAPKPPAQPKANTSAPEPVRVAGAKCARCGRPVQARFRPFCSQRCADIDLGQWASGTYRFPSGETPGSDDEP